MTFTLFCGLLAGLGVLTALIVEFIKSVLDGYKKNYNTQTVSLISGLVVGIVGTIVVYILMAIPFTALNIVFVIFEGLAVTIGAQLGYDKVLSVLKEAFKKTDA